MNTTYRLYTADRSAHWTAVSLRGGGLLETQTKQKFESFEAWRSARPEGVHLEETKRHSQAVIKPTIGSDTHGFRYQHINIPGDKVYSTQMSWMNWCYELMAEGAPHLLSRDDIRSAFNELVDFLCEKKVSMGSMYYKETYNVARYDPKCLFSDNMLCLGCMAKELREKAEKLINHLLDLIKADLIAFMEPKYKLALLLIKRSECKLAINKFSKRIVRFEKKAADARVDYSNSLKQMDTLVAAIAAMSK
jgi:hypothetical protein